MKVYIIDEEVVKKKLRPKIGDVNRKDWSKEPFFVRIGDENVQALRGAWNDFYRCAAFLNSKEAIEFRDAVTPSPIPKEAPIHA